MNTYTLKEQTAYVKKVFHSCKTAEQFGHAALWVKNWCHRMSIQYPDKVTCLNTLYSKIVSDEV